MAGGDMAAGNGRSHERRVPYRAGHQRPSISCPCLSDVAWEMRQGC